MPHHRFADIAIPGVPKSTLTYLIPENVREQIRRGRRVLVPLGRRIVTGVCIRLHDAQPSFPAKHVREVIEEDTPFNETLITLAEWIADYYYCPLGDALKAALPQGVELESEQYVHILTDNIEEAKTHCAKSKQKLSIIEALQTGEFISVAELQSITGYKSLASALRELERDGLIARESIVSKPKVSKKKILVVTLHREWMQQERLRELIGILETRAPKQVNIVTSLYQLHQEGMKTVPMTQLLLKARASSAQVRALEEKEIVTVESEEALRAYEQQYEEAPQSFELTAQQRNAVTEIIAAIDTNLFHPFLLHGVTASGKTQVYIEAIRHLLTKGRTAIVLVPEIALTPQLVFRFKHAFGNDVAVLHSRMSLGERYDAWRMTLQQKFKVLVGVRSAIFAPLENVGLIVVDEEHESTFKQNDPAPRYHARDTAIVRAKIENAIVVLGSATPSCESYQNAVSGKYTLISMADRIDDATMPKILPIDIAQAKKQNLMRGSFSVELIRAIEERIQKKEGTILLQNRRGFAPHVECNDCGHIEQCVNCSISMTYHKVRNQLRCHYCGDVREVPNACPRCGGVDLLNLGVGTQRVEEDVTVLIPGARIIRMDLDTTSRKGAHDAYLTAFQQGDADVLLGTQMVSKGLDFPRVTLVGVINADQSLLLPDFRSSERTFQMLTQVSGRSGRGKAAGEVMIQTTQQAHPVLQCVFAHDYHAYMEMELRMRKAFHYPPYSRLVLIEFTGENEEEVRVHAQVFSKYMVARSDFFYRHAPTPAAIKRINKKYRYHILVKVNKQLDPHGKLLSDYLRRVEEKIVRDGKKSRVRVTIDVDPQQLM